MEKINYRHLFVLLLRLLLTGVFVLAALPKIKDPVAFAESVSAFQVVGPGVSSWIALTLPWLELIIGIGLLIPQIRTAGSLLIAALLVIFITLHASAWIRGLEISCGCFGTQSALEESTNYLWLIVRNTMLLVACIIVISKDRTDTDPNVD